MKNTAMAEWRLMLSRPLNGDIEKRYDELISSADNLLARGIIDCSEWRELVRTAGSYLVGSSGRKYH
jgi:hypothetical protein